MQSLSHFQCCDTFTILFSWFPPFFYFQFFRLRVDTPHRVMVDWIMNDSFMGQLRMLIYHICPFTLWLQYTSNNCMLKLGRCLLLFLNVRVIMNSTSQSITTIQTMCDDDDRSCAQICFCFRIPKIITSIVLFHCSGVYSSTSIDLDLGLVCIYIYIYTFIHLPDDEYTCTHNFVCPYL